MEQEKAKKAAVTPGWLWSHTANQALLFLTVGLASIALQRPGYFMPVSVTWLAIALLGLVVLLMLYGMMRKNVSYVWWEAVLLLMAYGGIWVLFLAIFPSWLAVMVAAALTILPFFLPLTLVSNLTMIVGTAGVGLLVAMYFPVQVLLVCAAGVAAYEHFRAKGADMATLLSEAWHAGVVPGLLVPTSPRGWLKGIGETWQPGQGVVAGFLPFMCAAGMGYVAVHKGYILFLGFSLATVMMSALMGRGPHGVLRWWAFPTAAAISFAAIVLGSALV